MITLENISAAILMGINIKINAQDFVVLLGNNGAGKSTLLHLLAGHIPALKGKLSLNDREISQLNIRQKSRFIRYVPQNTLQGICDSLTIEENLLFAMRSAHPTLRLASTPSRRRQLQALLHEVNLGFADRLQQPVALLSGGERQALNIIMATFTAPQVLLLDEPTAALDPVSSQKLLKFIQELYHKYKLTIIMVTHRLEEARILGNRFVFLRAGKILHDIEQAQLDSFPRDYVCNFFAQLYH